MSPPALLPRLLALLFASASLAACASAPRSVGLAGAAEPASPPLAAALRPTLPAEDDASALGLYLAAEAALDGGDSPRAAHLFARASLAAPDDAAVRQRAFTTNLLAGDVTAAARLASSAGGTDPESTALGRLVRAVDALADGRGKEAAQLLSDPAAPRSLTPAAALLLPWAQAEAGASTPAPAPPPSGADKATGRFAALGRARLLERAGDLKAAEAVFKPLAGDGPPLAVLAYGGFLERRGRRAEAIALYDTALRATPEPSLRAARARAAAGRPAPPQPTVRQGAAEALLGPATALAGARRPDVGLIYVRLALRLDPAFDQAWLMAGDTLTAAGETDAARDAYRRVREDGPEGPAALERLALAAQTAGDKPEALRLARRAAELAPGDRQAGVVLADVLRTQNRLDEAIAVLDPLVAQAPAGEEGAQLFFMRGSALERAGRWPQAEADLQRALALKPGDPEISNYLGFAWADRGLHLKEALAMLEKAAAARPQQGAVLDSVGWARLRMGDVKGAVRDLERAVAMEPSDPEINDHLGDAYQRTGRSAEARYQWRRVLTLDPEDKTRAAAEAKLRQAGELLPPRPAQTASAPGAPAA